MQNNRSRLQTVYCLRPTVAAFGQEHSVSEFARLTALGWARPVTLNTANAAIGPKQKYRLFSRMSS